MEGVVSGEDVLVDVKSETPNTDQSHRFDSEMRSYLTQTGGATRIGGSVCLTLIQNICRLCFELDLISLSDSARDKSGTLRGECFTCFVVVAISRLFRREVDRGNELPAARTLI